ncbi:MAG TPA: proton-conducting transporter membrane subunit [Polyangium sp.]|nr:proton-conducting transporter membrane subunit [Polyangium sp.]
MSAFAGPLVPASSPYVALDRLPLVLLLGALFVAFAGHRIEPRRRQSFALAAIGMALGLLGVHAWQLIQLEASRRVLRDVTTNLVRIGSFDANLGCSLDPTNTVLLLVSLTSSAFFLARTKFVKKNASAGGPFQASVLLLSAGVSTALLADGFLGLLLGLSLSSVATFLLIVRDERLANSAATASRTFLMQSAGSACLLAAGVALFWGLGGSWPADGYVSDFRARFVPIYERGQGPKAEDVVKPTELPKGERDAAAIAQRAKERGSLTFTSHPGTRVFIDVGDKVFGDLQPFATTPFVRKDISTGPHEVLIFPGGAAIVSGDGNEVGWIERLDVRAGEEVTIVPLGQTMTFAEIDDQLELVDDEGKHFLRNALLNRTLWGSMGVVPLVVFLATLGVFLLGSPALSVLWFGRLSSTPAWNVVRIAAVPLTLVPLLRLHALVTLHLDIVASVVVLGALLLALLRARRPAWILGVAAMTLVLLQGTAVAQAAKDDVGHLVLRPEFGNVVELEYTPDGEAMHGAFVIRNDGAKPVQVTSARLRGNEAVRHSPSPVTFEVEGSNGDAVLIDPGKQRRVVMRWRYGASRAREFFGHVFVEANAESSPVVLPVHASRPRDLGPFGDRALSFLVGFPLFGALVAFALRLLRRDTPRMLASANGLVFGAHFTFVLAIFLRFDERLARAEGNDGLQFIERSVVLPNWGVEWFWGIDGISLVFILLTSIAALLATVASWSAKHGRFGFHVSTPILISSLMGIFLAQDLFFFCFFWFVGILILTGMFLRFDDAADRRAAVGLAAIALAGGVFLGASAHWLHEHSGLSYLVNGQSVMRTWALPDLARVNWVNGHSAPTGFVLVWSAVFVGFAARIVTLGSVFAFSRGPAGMIFPVVWSGPALYGLLRLNLGIMPAGLQWAANTVLFVGLAIVVVFGLLARLTTNLRVGLGHIATAHSGFALLGLGSCTPQGIAAVVHILASLTFGMALLGLAMEVFEQHKQSSEMGQLFGLSRNDPWLASVFIGGLFVLLGLPGLAGLWGPLLAIVGAFPRTPFLAIMAIVALVFLGATGLRVVAQMFDKASGKSTAIPPTPNEWAVLALLVVFVVGLGFSPRTLFLLLDAVILDLHRLVDGAGALQVG